MHGVAGIIIGIVPDEEGKLDFDFGPFFVVDGLDRLDHGSLFCSLFRRRHGTLMTPALECSRIIRTELSLETTELWSSSHRQMMTMYRIVERIHHRECPCMYRVENNYMHVSKSPRV